jgi:exonuclease III
VTSARKKIIIIALNKSPSRVLHEFIVHLTDILEQLVQKDCCIIFVGDININIQEDGRGHKQLSDVANICNLHQPE